MKSTGERLIFLDDIVDVFWSIWECRLGTLMFTQLKIFPKSQRQKHLWCLCCT